MGFLQNQGGLTQIEPLIIEIYETAGCKMLADLLPNLYLTHLYMCPCLSWGARWGL